MKISKEYCDTPLIYLGQLASLLMLPLVFVAYHSAYYLTKSLEYVKDKKDKLDSRDRLSRLERL